MILSTYEFDGEPEVLIEQHRQMVSLFPPNALDLHVAVSTETGLTVFDSCPDLATHNAFVTSPEFLGTIDQVGLPRPRITIVGDVHFATMNQSVIR
jgi:hypothetical protein